MANAIDTAAVSELRNFAQTHNELQFAHLCTAAINGDQWATDSIEFALERVAKAEFSMTRLGAVVSGDTIETLKLRIIRTTDTARPDGGIARKFEI